MEQDYPSILPASKKTTWTQNDVFNKGPFYHTKAYYHQSPKYDIFMHEHKFYEINIITNGHGMHYINKNHYPSIEGSVFVIPPNVSHGYFSKDNMEIFHLLLNSNFMNNYYSELNGLPAYTLLFEIEPFIRSGFNEANFLILNKEELEDIKRELDDLVAFESMSNKDCQIMKIGKALYLISKLTDIISKRGQTINFSGNPYAKEIIGCIEYMRSNYADNISMDFLAKKSGLSRSSFFRHFKDLCKISPLEYLTQYRLNKVKPLLALTNKSILEIALESGFYDSSHLNRIFIKSENISPISYRKLYQS